MGTTCSHVFLVQPTFILIWCTGNYCVNPVHRIFHTTPKMQRRFYEGIELEVDDWMVQGRFGEPSLRKKHFRKNLFKPSKPREPLPQRKREASSYVYQKRTQKDTHSWKFCFSCLVSLEKSLKKVAFSGPCSTSLLGRVTKYLEIWDTVRSSPRIRWTMKNREQRFHRIDRVIALKYATC